MAGDIIIIGVSSLFTQCYICRAADWFNLLIFSKLLKVGAAMPAITEGVVQQ